MSVSCIVQSVLQSPATRWAVGGWSFFIVENVVLSENRSYLIQQVGEDSYHTIYGTLSTIAMGSTAYGYYYHVRNAQPFLWKTTTMPLTFKLAGWISLSLGFGIASQTVPKLQIPLTRNHHNTTTTTTTTTSTGGGSKWQVRCPFDFTDGRTVLSNNHNALLEEKVVSGVDRISRHPGLFSFGLVSLGYGLLVPSIPMQLFFSMPMAVAIIGGAHTDSRHRRNIGGTLPSYIDQQTSLIPFLALLSGKQQQNKETTTLEQLQDFWIHDVKKLNLSLAMGLATMIVLRKARPIHHTTSSLGKNIIR